MGRVGYVPEILTDSVAKILILPPCPKLEVEALISAPSRTESFPVIILILQHL
jgi:hypothetical protein